MRAAAQRWLVGRALNLGRAVLARADTPSRLREWTARAAPHLGRREPFASMPAFRAGEASARWIAPPEEPRGGVIVYFHGGAFVAEARAIHDPFLAALGRAVGVRGLMVDYRLAPEHPFPAATEDCFAVWNHLLTAGFDPSRIVFAGDSSGGNLALVTAMRARDEEMPLPAAIVLVSPLLDLTFGGASFARNDGVDPAFRAAAAHRIAEWYAPGLDLRDPRISPLFGRTDGLPPTLLVAGSTELLLDDALRYAALAPDARVAVWHGMPHAFPAIRGLAEGDRAIAEIAGFIREHTATA